MAISGFSGKEVKANSAKDDGASNNNFIQSRDNEIPSTIPPLLFFISQPCLMINGRGREIYIIIMASFFT